jgi:hypothetical protein
MTGTRLSSMRALLSASHTWEIANWTPLGFWIEPIVGVLRTVERFVKLLVVVAVRHTAGAGLVTAPSLTGMM